MESPGRVVVVGSANIDSTFSVARLPAAGETVTGAVLSEAQGGVGANQALAAARAGATVELLAAVGGEESGAGLLAGLAREGVGVNHCLRLAGETTGRAAIWVEESGENRIVVAGGANVRLDAGAVAGALATIEGAAVVLCQLETPPGAAAAALSWAREHGALGVLNASPAPAIASLPEGAQVLIVNQGEAQALAGSAVGDPAADAATIATALGTDTVVVTTGAAGAIAHHRGESLRTAAPAIDPVDTTGAGDAFTGALASRLAAGEPLERALAFAAAAGALATTGVGATTAIAARPEIERLLRGEGLPPS